MKILFVGGIGNISWYCTQKALEKGHEIWHLNREQSVVTRRKVQAEVHKLRGDIRKPEEIEKLLGDARFDIVVDFVTMNGEQAEIDVRLFGERTKLFFAISSDVVYKRKPCMLPFTENSERYDLGNSGSCYIEGKLEAEKVFSAAWTQRGFPVVIIRPSHTYDTIIPVCIGHNCYTSIYKLREGYPLLIAGDGNQLRTFTHSKDFADALVGLFEVGNIEGECFHIAARELLTWNEQSEILLKSLGENTNKIYHIPLLDAINYTKIQDREMNIQKYSGYVFDLHKIESFVPKWKSNVSFEEGIAETLSWMQEDSIRMRRVEWVEAALDEIYKKYGVKNNGL